MLVIILTFLLTTALHCILLWLAVRRVSCHLKDNEAAVKAVVDHVLIPLLGRRHGDANNPPADEPQMPETN